MPVSVRRRLVVSIRQAFLWAFLPTLLLVLDAPDVAYAQVPTSITSTTGAGDLGTTVTHTGNLYDITGGTRPGNGLNLFHSFGEFSVPSNNIANFLNETAIPTSNILSRVTGGNPSNIFGTIQTTDFGAANLYLINPAGVIFGPTASLNVGGTFAASTADYLKMADGASFYAVPVQSTVLSIAPVAAFGFLSSQPAPIVVQGSLLQVPEGQSLSLVGGDITVQAETFEDGTMQAATLRAPGGHLNLVSVASPGEVLLPSFQTGPNINGASFTGMGTVMIKDEGTTLDVSGQLDEFGTPIGNGNSGTVLVRGGQLVMMDASTILAITHGAVDGERAAVDIQVSQTVALTNGSTIATLTVGSGRGGDVQLTAPTLTMEDASTIFTGTFDGDGAGGDVVLNVGTVSLMDGASIQTFSSNFTPGLGQGGNVTIQGLEGAGSAAESVALSGDSSLSTQTFGSSEGGRVAITSNSLTMEGALTIVNTSAFDVGRGGDIEVSVQQASLSGGARITTLTSFSDVPDVPQGPTLTVQGLSGKGSRADSIVLSGFGSGIVSDSTGAGHAGDVALHAKAINMTDGAVIQGGAPNTTAAGGNVVIEANSVDISGDSHIASQASRSDAGQVTITANQVTLNNGSVTTSTVSEGRGGDVVLNAGTVSLSNGANINSSTNSSGRAGDITIGAGTVTLSGGSKISSASNGTEPSTNFDGTTEPPGTAGNITITATGSFTSDGSTMATLAEANHGGDISITAQNVRLSDGTLITANSKAPPEVTKLVLDQDGQLVSQVVGDGNAGNITAHSGSTFVMNNSSMTTEAIQASGGQIEITAPEMVQLSYSKISTSVAGSAVDTAGGNITIDPQFVVLQNSQVIAQAFAGAGGTVSITAGLFLADPASIVVASFSTWRQRHGPVHRWTADALVPAIL